MRWVNKPQTRGLCKRTLHGHLAGTFGAVWARGGRGVISCSEDRTLKAWSAITGEFLRDLGEHEKAIHVLASSPWGETFASGSEDGVVKVWSISSASEIATVVPFRLGVSSIDVAFYNNSMLLATAGGDAVKLWRLPTLDKRGGLYGHKKRVSAVRFCPSAPVAATGSWDSSVMVWAQSSPLVWLNVQVLSGHSDMVRSLAWSPQGSTLVSASSDKTVKIWKGSEAPEVSEWRLAATIDGHTDAVTDVKFHPQGQTVLTCSRDSKVKLFDTNVPFETSPVVSHSLPVLLAAVCGKKQVAVTVSEDQEVKVWEYTTGTFLVSQSSSHSSGISAIALSSDGRFVLTGGRDGAIRRREIQGLAPAGVQQEVKRAHQGGVAVLEHHREESFLLSAGRSDGRIVVWESEALLDLAVLVVGEGSVIYRALFSSDSKFVISADDKRGMRLWNIETGREVFAQTLGSSEKLAKVDFSSDGRFIATVKTSSEQIEVWDASGGGLKGSLKKHQGKVVDTSFSTDGKFLSSIATDKNLIVWRLSSLRPLCSFSLAQSPCCLCAYQAWPCLVVGDQIGSVFFLTFVEPQPPEESDEED
ncbi:hypothetical protein GUITHDRAFT_68900 [Guillardia theta CCMP2712]|uniref:Uncharacterized protein n=1 Tax=Guillardia theta (strain CCMP2712) TaxID=905079 RepID=L1JI94_GUITC|nr:hypothetical protein GUITHDRAFT_68900 [Guillardia theta CCMP2712]EKX48047.1 hypothetical protein GUITHDRAFT_68900 [Guillardia theta CCMP2712]|eukprot:XP_005835027.1 hypothetical protein GUITHDRAFT_68900 [Guillardia theta CCMP2712]